MKFKIVYADELYKVQKEMNALLIDIRTREEYDRSHWKGALSMPMDITDSYESELDASQSDFLLHAWWKQHEAGQISGKSRF